MKKLLSVLLTLALAAIVAAGMTVFAAAETETQTTGIIYGDANGDGAVNMKDVLTIRKYVAGIAVDIDLVAADTNGDGAVNMKDVLTVRKFVAGLIPVIEGGETEPTGTGVEPTETDVEPTTQPTTTPTSGNVCYPKNALLAKGVYHDSDGSSYVSEEYTYDENGNMTCKRSYCEDGSVDWWCSSDYTYDENGNQTSERAYYDDGTVRTWFESIYDAKGNKTSSRRYNDDGSVDGWTEYTYDANGNETSERDYNADGSVVWWTEHTYDANGNQTSYRSYNDDGSVDGWIEYTYDANGNMIRESHLSSDGSVWSESFYDSNGNETGHRCYFDDEIDWINSYDCAYDENGGMTKTEYTKDGTPYIGEKYTYDTNGNDMGRRRYYANGSVDWMGSYDCTYDVKGNRTSFREYNEDGKKAYGWEDVFDDNGNVVKEIHYLEIGVIGWYEYTYDANGNELTATCYNDDGSLDYWYEYIYLNQSAPEKAE